MLDFAPRVDPIITKTLTVNEDGTFIVRLYGKQVQTDSPLLRDWVSPLNRVTTLGLLHKLSSTNLCTGYTDPKYIPVTQAWDARKKEQHVFHQRVHVNGKVTSVTVRSEKCTGYVSGRGALCNNCVDFGNTLRPAYLRFKHYIRRSNERSEAGSSVPITHLTHYEAQDRAKKAAKERKKLRQQVRRLQGKIQQQIKDEGTILGQEQSDDFLQIMKDNTIDVRTNYPVNSFGRLFWEEQMKAASAKGKTGHRWHPMIIKWALNLKLSSGRAYRSIRGSNVIKLPHESTLREYLHWSPPKAKFTVEAVEQLCVEMDLENIQPYQRNIVLIHDEMKIKSDLVFRKNTGELVGFTDLDTTVNTLRDYEAMLTNDSTPEKSLAKYMFVIMVRGLFVNVTYPLAQFPTANTKSDEIFSLCWRAIDILEMAGLNVVAITCDGASTNRKFFDLHGEANTEQDKPIHRTPNPYNPDAEIFLISDPPHLIKCVRNAWASSYAHEKTRTLWVRS